MEQVDSTPLLFKEVVYFKPKSILRYYPPNNESEHYSAVVLSNNTLLQVKTPSGVSKIVFETVEQWLESLPHHPSTEDLKVEKNPKKKSSEKISKPSKISLLKSDRIPWLNSILSFVTEMKSPLVKDDLFIKSFNDIVIFVDSHSNDFLTYSPSVKRYRYKVPLEFKLSHPEPLKGFPISIHQKYIDLQLYGYNRYYSISDISKMKLNENGTKLIEELFNAYQPLYELIKVDVIPYVQKKGKSQVLYDKIKYSQYHLRSFNKKLDRRRIVYENGLKRLQAEWERYSTSLTNSINELNDKIKMYTTELENL
jgi:hypothetical protein